MDILFIGFSSIVRRKVLPAAIKAGNIGKISIASSKQPQLDDVDETNIGHIYNDYDEALLNTSGSLVYISFPNALHAAWVEKALQAGNHVIVDKPAFMLLDDAKRLVELARSLDLLLAEANVWTYHSLFKDMKEYIKGKAIRSIYANFSSPPLDQNNFRYNPDMGAGILLDRGSYAVSCIRELIAAVPDTVCSALRFSQSRRNVDIDLSMMARFSDKRSFLGFFSLECEYVNSLEIIGEDFRVCADRIFTPPPGIELEYRVQHSNETSIITVAPCDTFQVFLDDVVSSIHTITHNKFGDILLYDALLFEQITQACHQQDVIT